MVARRHAQRVPAHMRDLQRRVGRRDGARPRLRPSRALASRHARARASPSAAGRRRCRERACPSAAPSLPAPRPCRDGVEARACSRRRRRRRAARCARRAATSSGSAVTLTASLRTGLARRALEGLGGGVEIAGAVIDDGDVHGSAQACGKSPITPSPSPRGGRRASCARCGAGIAVVPTRWALARQPGTGRTELGVVADPARWRCRSTCSRAARAPRRGDRWPRRRTAR